MKQNRHLAAIASSLMLSLVLGACASKSPAPVVERGSSAATPTAASAAAAKDFYTVKKGDTLYSIALDHGLGPRELAAMNNIENPNRILVGQQLRVRAAGAGAPAPAGDGVVTQPIGGGGVESRPLESSPATAQPVAATGRNTATLKVEPKAGKEPYSEQVLLQAQNQGQGPTPVPAVKPEETAVAVKPAEPRVESAGADDVPWAWPSTGKLVTPFNDATSKGIDIGGKAGDPVLAAGDGKVVYAGTGLRGYGQLVIVKHNGTFLSAYAHNQKLLVKEGQSVTRGQKIAEMGNTDADQVKLHFEIRRQGKPVDPGKYLPAR